MVLPSSLSSYGSFTGDLFLYAPGRAAFESPSTAATAPPSSFHNNKKKCILLGGLTDGLIPVPYAKRLEECCIEHGFSMVQPILSSSYSGFGHGTLDRDCTELVELMEYLQTHRSSSSSTTTTTTTTTKDDNSKEEGECQFCLVGHSTGCQQIVHFLKVAPPAVRDQVCVAALQAPVSDREHGQVGDPAKYAQCLAKAQEMRQANQLDECMPRQAFFVPITARRFLDLQERGGKDDYFSSDYSDEELAARLSHVLMFRKPTTTTTTTTTTTATTKQRHVLVAFSGADEYVPASVDTQLLTNRLVQAMNSSLLGEKTKAPDSEDEPCGMATGICIPGANHNLSEPESAGREFVEQFGKLLKAINQQ